MAGFNHNPSKSGSSNNGNSGYKSNKPSGGYNRQGSSNQGEKKEFAPTTHYMVTGGKGEERQFAQGVFITEVNDGLRVYIKEDVKAGTYFINKKKDKSADAPKF